MNFLNYDPMGEAMPSKFKGAPSPYAMPGPPAGTDGVNSSDFAGGAQGLDAMNADPAQMQGRGVMNFTRQHMLNNMFNSNSDTMMGHLMQFMGHSGGLFK